MLRKNDNQHRAKILCVACNATAMRDRIPHGHSRLRIHRYCWPCAMRYSNATEAQLVVAILRGLPGGPEALEQTV